MIAHQDYELAEQFMNMDMSYGLNEDGSVKDGKTVGKYLFHMEGILDLTDRTQVILKCHLHTKIEVANLARL